MAATSSPGAGSCRRGRGRGGRWVRRSRCGWRPTGDRVQAFCSLDGEKWYPVGHTTFPMDDEVQVGVHAIGMIDRAIYHGAYPEGTAIRFTSFRTWA